MNEWSMGLVFGSETEVNTDMGVQPQTFLFWRNTEEHRSRTKEKPTTHLDKTTDIT